MDLDSACILNRNEAFGLVAALHRLGCTSKACCSAEHAVERYRRVTRANRDNDLEDIHHPVGPLEDGARTTAEEYMSRALFFSLYICSLDFPGLRGGIRGVS